MRAFLPLILIVIGIVLLMTGIRKQGPALLAELKK